MKYSPKDMLAYVEEEGLVLDFLQALQRHVKQFTIAEITDRELVKEKEEFRLRSKGCQIDVEIKDDEIITAILNELYVSAFLSRKDNSYQVHFLVHPYPTSMKGRFEEEIAKEVIHYMIINTIVTLALDTHGKIKSYIEG